MYLPFVLKTEGRGSKQRAGRMKQASLRDCDAGVRLGVRTDDTALLSCVLREYA
jgi:hypothetical protein